MALSDGRGGASFPGRENSDFAEKVARRCGHFDFWKLHRTADQVVEFIGRFTLAKEHLPLIELHSTHERQQGLNERVRLESLADAHQESVHLVESPKIQ